MVASGVYRQIKKPEKLVYTWTWEGGPEAVETLVTVEFREKGQQTEVLLTHEKLPNAKARQDHTEGWIACFDKLEPLVRT